MVNHIFPKTINLVHVKNGELVFVCSCGRVDSTRLKEFNKKTRCQICTKANAKLIAENKVVNKFQIYELFDTMKQNGLYNFVNKI